MIFKIAKKIQLVFCEQNNNRFTIDSAREIFDSSFLS